MYPRRKKENIKHHNIQSFPVLLVNENVGIKEEKQKCFTSIHLPIGVHKVLF